MALAEMRREAAHALLRQEVQDKWCVHNDVRQPPPGHMRPAIRTEHDHLPSPLVLPLPLAPPLTESLDLPLPIGG